LWTWETPCCYFGIPWSNFAGWLLASALITLVLRPQDLPLLPLLLIYTATWLLETVGLGIFWGMPGPALGGFFVMGMFVTLGWRQVTLVVDGS
jgi:putative membrane protein